MKKVLIMPPVLRDRKARPLEILSAAGLEPIFPERMPVPVDEQRRLLAEADAVIASVEPYTREILKDARVGVIARMGVGYDAVDVAAASERNIAVTITPGTNEHSVAETALALLLGVFRGLPYRYHEVRTGKWTKRTLPRLAGKTIGLVGLGRIGRAMVARCQGLGLKVIAADPLAPQDWAAQHQVRLCSLDELLATADIVSLHSPAVPETEKLINRRTLAQMKRGSVLINTARGALVDEDALLEALRAGHLLAAGLDVFQIEPLPTDSPLLQLDNVLALPHIAGLDEESLEAMGNMAAQCVADLAQGRWPEGCVVNEAIRPNWKWPS